MATKRKKKTDHDTASSESHELETIQDRFKHPVTGKKPPISLVRSIQKEVGQSRPKIYNKLKELGYELQPARKSKKAKNRDKQGDGDATN